MSTPNLSFPLRRGGASMRRTRRATRFALQCEPLETRQLLSVGQAGLAASAAFSAANITPQIPVSAQIFNPTPASVSVIDVEFGSLSGVVQVEIIIFSTSAIFSPTPAPSSGGSGSGLGTLSGLNSNSSSGTTGSLFPTSSTVNPSITPLNPNATSITNTAGGGAPVYIVPPPLAALAVHLGSSTGPATNQSNSTLISNLDEQPTVLSHFGQSDDSGARRVFLEKIEVKPKSTSLIDDIEPFRPIAPDEVPPGQAVPQGEQAPAPDDAKVLPFPVFSDPTVDAALDMTDARVLTRSRDADASDADDEFSSTNTSWSFSAIFGAAAVATAGYHLALREADRFQGRWIPRWAGAERPTKRKAATPSR